MNQNLSNGFIIGINLGIFTGFIVLFFMIGSIGSNVDKNLVYKAISSELEKNSYYYRYDDYAINVTKLCSRSIDDYSKVDCVVNEICSIYNFKNHGILNQLMKSPSEIKLNGGVCRDYAVLYKAIFDNLEIDSKIIAIHSNSYSSHAYNLVNLSNEIYKVDACLLEKNA